MPVWLGSDSNIPFLVDMVYAVVLFSTLPGRVHLCLADSGQYDIQHVSSLVGSGAFSVAGLQAWNQLPHHSGTLFATD